MLIEFSVSNFRSIKETVTLSMVADSDARLPENVLARPIPGMRNTRLLKSAVIYGANAAGKSNLYRAAAFMQDFVVNYGRRQKGDKTGVVPFRLEESSAQGPSEFEVIFVHDGVRYQYGFALDREKIHEEWLTAYPKGKPQCWFRRTLKKGSGPLYDYDFLSRNFKGEKGALAKRTNENILFLSKGADNNHTQLSVIYEWFGKHFRFLDFSFSVAPSRKEHLTHGFTASLIHDSEVYREKALAILGNADLGICDVKTQEVELTDEQISNLLPKEASEEARTKLASALAEDPPVALRLRHASAEDLTALFDIWDESSGTQKILSLLGPWLDTLESGYTLFIDEIGANMHPLLIRQMLKMMQISNSEAQVVLTTHETSLMDRELLRRDQIWFTEKKKSGATALYPLTDYSPRSEEALEKGYLAGRYGGIPFLTQDFGF